MEKLPANCISVNRNLDPKLLKSGWKTARPLTISELGRLITTHSWSPSIWKDGVRNQSNFLQASYGVLDFDAGKTIEEVIGMCCDKKLAYIIAPTRNHLKEKNGVVAERFRLILKFRNPIEKLDQFRYNISLLILEFGSDPSCKDGARFYFPSQKVSHCKPGEATPIWAIPPHIKEQERSFRSANNLRKASGELPRWVLGFLDHGAIVGCGRNNTIYACALVLKDLGMNKDDIISKVKQAPFSRQDFPDSEIIAAVNSAFRR